MGVMSRARDPRFFQIATLTSLVGYGFSYLDFHVSVEIGLTILVASLATQWAASRLAGLPRFDPKSALISALSLCLLLRTGSLPLAALTAVVTIGSKFAIRFHGRHIFNPTNFGLAVMVVATNAVWVSPGQWGASAFAAFAFAGLGGLVTYRAATSDVTFSFLLSYSGILCARALWLGDPLSLPLHQLQSGTLLLFAFFMISDPKTTPDSRLGRIVFACSVAAGAAFVQFALFEPNGLLWSLVVCSPLTPVLNRLLPGRRYQWQWTPVPERSFA